LRLVSFIYSYSWDIYMDWGLLRTKVPGKWGLRPKLMYPIWFYYFASFTNLLLRLVWIFPLIDKFFGRGIADSHLHVFLISTAELFRRA
jgi:hypothetical protein